MAMKMKQMKSAMSGAMSGMKSGMKSKMESMGSKMSGMAKSKMNPMKGAGKVSSMKSGDVGPSKRSSANTDNPMPSSSPRQVLGKNNYGMSNSEMKQGYRSGGGQMDKAEKEQGNGEYDQKLGNVRTQDETLD